MTTAILFGRGRISAQRRPGSRRRIVESLRGTTCARGAVQQQEIFEHLDRRIARPLIDGDAAADDLEPCAPLRRGTSRMETRSRLAAEHLQDLSGQPRRIDQFLAVEFVSTLSAYHRSAQSTFHPTWPCAQNRLSPLSRTDAHRRSSARMKIHLSRDHTREGGDEARV